MTALTAETIVAIETPHDVQVSPDGALAAFVVAAIGQREEHPSSAIWIAPTDGASPARKLTAGVAEDSSPRWAPGGDALYFLSDRAKRGVAQIYRIALAGGEAEALSDWQPGVKALVPLADGAAIAFLAADVETAEEKARQEERDDAQVYGERWPRHRLRVLDVASREVTTIDALSELHIAEMAPAAAGGRIAVVAWPTPELDYRMRDAEIHMVDSANCAAWRVCVLTNGGSHLTWGEAQRDLLFLAHTGRDGRGGAAVYAVAAAGGEPRQVMADLSACPMDLAARHDGVTYVLAAEGLDSWVGRLDPAAARAERLYDCDGDAWSLSVSADGRTIALARSRRDDAGDVWSCSAGVLRRLSDLNPVLRNIAWGSQERIAWQAPDGLTIAGLLILPPGATPERGPFPLMTLVHGGPYSRFSDKLQLGWGNWGQWLATAGYAVLLPNPRGGMGRGDDFADRVVGAVGQEDWADISSGIDHLIASGVAYPERLGIGGWSQGGFMTAWAVGQTDRFKLGIMGAGISDWGMMLATGDLPHFEVALGGSAAWDGPGPHRHDALSPISFAARVATPVLILHGEDDARVPVSQGRFFALALRQHGIPCQLVIYPREKHPIRERNHQLDLLRRVREWTEQWMGDGG